MTPAFTVAIATVLPSVILFLGEMWFILNPHVTIAICAALKAACMALVAII